jgi:hypothetical protein
LVIKFKICLGGWLGGTMKDSGVIFCDDGCHTSNFLANTCFLGKSLIRVAFSIILLLTINLFPIFFVAFWLAEPPRNCHTFSLPHPQPTHTTHPLPFSAYPPIAGQDLSHRSLALSGLVLGCRTGVVARCGECVVSSGSEEKPRCGPAARTQYERARKIAFRDAQVSCWSDGRISSGQTRQLGTAAACEATQLHEKKKKKSP